MDHADTTFDQAKAYQRKRQLLTFIHLILTPSLLLVAIVMPISQMFNLWSFQISSNLYAALACYFVFFALYTLIFDFPLAFYSGFLLEHQFALSNQTLLAWVKDFFKKSALSFLLSLLLLEGLFALIWNFPSLWWIFAWAGYALVSFGLGKVFPVLIVPLFYKYGKLENQSLKEKIFNLANRYGLPLENVYTLDLSKTTKKANAAFMGMGKTKRVVLSDTLLANFTEEEIETVVAHELGHFKHHDIWKQLGLGILTSLAGFWIVFRLMEPLTHFFGFNGPADIASMPLLFLIFYVFGLGLMPLQNGFSRCLERAADGFALSACPDRNVFISCMEKLGKVNLADPDPHPLYEWIFYDHPSIGKRIRMAKMQAG